MPPQYALHNDRLEGLSQVAPTDLTSCYLIFAHASWCGHVDTIMAVRYLLARLVTVRTGADMAMKSDPDERQVEELARELAHRLRGMKSRQELTDYAVSVLRDSAEEAHQEEQARQSVERAAKVGSLNTVAFGLPLGVIGLVLCATGILAGPGLIILGVAVLMVVYGMAAALFFRPRKPPADRDENVEG
jgi:hypothetical protein